MRGAIQIPPASLARLEAMIVQREQLNALIDTTITTLRDALDVPDDYQITDIRSGFVPPSEQETDAAR